MDLSPWIYFFFTAFLAFVMAGILYYYYGPNADIRRSEAPKYRMLEAEENEQNGGKDV